MTAAAVTFEPCASAPERDDALAFLREIAGGRWRLAARKWDEGRRTLLFEPHERPRPASRRELEALALVSRGAANGEAGWVLGLRGSTVCMHATRLAQHMSAGILDLVALGPLLERERCNGLLDRRRTHARLAYTVPLEVLRVSTPSELAVACLLADGLSNEEIGARRAASTRTVANQVATLYQKLGVRSRRECVLRLYGGRLVPIDAGALAIVDQLASRS
jgi:DNA-binding NarL/FixJ family response regulator